MSTQRLALGLILLVWCAPAVAQDTSVTPQPPNEKPRDSAALVSYGLETAFRSGHSDRGFLISDRAVFQPDGWVSLRGTELSLWSNFAIADATDGTRPEIVEAELTHTFKWKSLSIGPSGRTYFFQDHVSRSSGRSVEAWLYVSNRLGPFTLFTNHSVDLLDYRGGYFGEAGIEAEGKLFPGLAIGGSLGGGWANRRFNEYWAGVAKSAFDRVMAETWVTLYLAPHFYVGPHVEFSSIVDRDVRAGDLFSPRYFLFTFTTGVEFQ